MKRNRFFGDAKTLYKVMTLCQSPRVMRAMHKIFCASTLLALAASCTTGVITNLTPSTLPRNPNGQYLVEMQLNSRQQTLRPESITPYVQVGFNEHKMRPTPKMTNRWETYIPVPASENIVRYKFKVDYQYSRFGDPGQGSIRSDEYRLTIK